MSSMDWWVRKQVIMTNLNYNLKELYNEKIELMNTLIKISKMIEKHEAYLEKLEKEE
jgi:hypothetical protein